MRTPRGVLLHWDPPELVPKRLDGYVLEGRQGSQGWEVLDPAVAGTETELLVPGLIKVCARGNTGSSLLGALLHPSPFPKPYLLDLSSSSPHPTSPFRPTCTVFPRTAGMGGAGP